MTKKVFHGSSSDEIPCKRFYVNIEEECPTWECPICGKENDVDIFSGNHYLSYPVPGYSEGVYVYCDHSDTEFEDTEYFEDEIGTITLDITYTWEPE